MCLLFGNLLQYSLIVLCCCCIRIYATAEFTEPTTCSSDCSFINDFGVKRECIVKQVSFKFPTSARCSDLLQNKFLTNEEAKTPARFEKKDVQGMFSQSSPEDPIKIKIHVRISENSHNRINGVYFEIDEKLYSHINYDVKRCFLLDFKGTLTKNDIIPTYATGGDRILSFYPCMNASKVFDYSVTGYPLPLFTGKTDVGRNNYAYSFAWPDWQAAQCISDAEYYLNSDVTVRVGFEKLEVKINSSALFNYYCPLGVKILPDSNDKNYSKEIYFRNGSAIAMQVPRIQLKLKFFLKGLVENTFYMKEQLDKSIKGKCLSHPCGTSEICNQRGNKQSECSTCQTGEVLKFLQCFSVDPCLSSPCVDEHGKCEVTETSFSIYHTCTCYQGFYAAHNTCFDDPCLDNPCGDGQCYVSVSSTDIYRTCNCNSGFHSTQDDVCKSDPCFNNPCGNGDCERIEKDSGFVYSCQCHHGFYYKSGTCEVDPCAENPCSNGRCYIPEIEDGPPYICVCDPGFYLTQNTCKFDVCFNNPCVNGTCIRTEVEVGLYTCQCSSGYFFAQDTCKPDPCYNNPCGNGTCSIMETTLNFLCECDDGFYLVNDTCRTDPCYDNPCGNGTCHIKETSVFQFYCDCDDGFYIDNNTCRRNYCYVNRCHPGNCTNFGNSYTCSCPLEHSPADGKCVPQHERNIVLVMTFGFVGALIGVFLIFVVFMARGSQRGKEFFDSRQVPVHEPGVLGIVSEDFGNQKPVPSESEAGDRLFNINMIKRFISLSSTNASESSDINSVETARVDSTQNIRLVGRGCNVVDSDSIPSTSCQLGSQRQPLVEHCKAGYRPCSCNSADSSSRLVCDRDRHSKQSSIESEPCHIDHISCAGYAPDMESSL